MAVYSARLQNGPLEVGPLADRGAFDQYASYRPGQIVVDGGVVYLNIAPVGADPELEDVFGRRDQSGWGQSSHGEVWQTSAAWSGVGPPSLRANRGVMASHGGGDEDDAQLLGPSRLRADAEVLARLGVATALTAGLSLWLGLNGTEDGASQAVAHLAVSDTGTTQIGVTATADPNSPETGTDEDGPDLVSGTDVLVRLRRVGLVYTASVWLAGTPEPGTPQATLTATHAQPAGHPLVQLTAGDAGDGIALAYLSVRPLSAATAPSGDTDHWVALADALQVPQPL